MKILSKPAHEKATNSILDAMNRAKYENSNVVFVVEESSPGKIKPADLPNQYKHDPGSWVVLFGSVNGEKLKLIDSRSLDEISTIAHFEGALRDALEIRLADIILDYASLYRGSRGELHIRNAYDSGHARGYGGKSYQFMKRVVHSEIYDAELDRVVTDFHSFGVAPENFDAIALWLAAKTNYFTDFFDYEEDEK